MLAKYQKYFKIIFLFSAIYGIGLNLVGASNIIEQLSYFTLVSNMAVALVMILGLLQIYNLIKLNQTYLRVFKGATIISALTTVLIYSFVLIPYLRTNNIDYEIFSLEDLLLHYITPGFVLLDYLLFDQKGQYRIKDIIAFVYFPIGYLLYLVIYVLLGGRFSISGGYTIFPYFFLDYITYGIVQTLGYILLVLITFVGLGLLLYWFDQLIYKQFKSVFK